MPTPSPTSLLFALAFVLGAAASWAIVLILHHQIFSTKHAPKSTSQRLQTAHEVLEGYQTLSVDRILQPLNDTTFTQQILPASLGMPVRSKVDFSKQAMGIVSIFESFRMVPQQIYEDDRQNTVIIYAKMIGQLKRNMGPWENECIMIMGFSEDQKTVVSHREFVDSVKAREMKEKVSPKDF
ncbi:hypothetical protein C1H76_5400 [Elsinoe australis]|uniref:Uncharacterized protein n=1 Tax=Elsinoe australis TaxID=40998 RepID=A0A4U7B5C6_9PEZI|nr:hypothetical protein C1H76_5400 [Elsinoe australis]